jgi:hypothetical protein
MSFVAVPASSTIVQVLLQLIRQEVNDLQFFEDQLSLKMV